MPLLVPRSGLARILATTAILASPAGATVRAETPEARAERVARTVKRLSR